LFQFRPKNIAFLAVFILSTQNRKSIFGWHVFVTFIIQSVVDIGQHVKTGLHQFDIITVGLLMYGSLKAGLHQSQSCGQ